MRNPHRAKTGETAPSAETTANRRFIALFDQAIEEQTHATGPHAEPGRGQLWLAVIPRIAGWEPTQFDVIENAINRIDILKAEGWSIPELNSKQVLIGEPYSVDQAFTSLTFSINPDTTVSLNVRHLRHKPPITLPPLIAEQDFTQAPPAILTKYSDELERLLTP